MSYILLLPCHGNGQMERQGTGRHQSESLGIWKAQ